PFSSLVAIATASQLSLSHNLSSQLTDIKKTNSSYSRISTTDLVIGDYVFCYNDRPMVGIPRKFEIPYKGPFRIIKLFGNNVIVADGDKEVTYNITKTIKLRNFTIPQRDLYRRIVRNVDDHLDESIEDTFARANVLTDKLLQLKREGQLYKLAKQKVRESAPFDDNQEEKVDSVAKRLRDMRKAIKKIATTKIQPKLIFLPSTLQPDNFAIANVLNQN